MNPYKIDSTLKKIQPPTPILAGLKTKVPRVTSITPTMVSTKLSKSVPKYHRAKVVKNNAVVEKIEK